MHARIDSKIASPSLRAHQQVDGVLGVGHQPEHVALLVAHPRDVVLRAVWILAGRIAQQSPHRARRVVAAGRVLDRDREPLARCASACERAARIDHLERHLAAEKPQRGVGQQRARKQPGFAEHLKAVADAEHQPTVGRELRERLHHRREAGDRARAQVVAIREATGHDHRVDTLQVAIAVPQQHRLADAAGGLQRIDLVARAGEANDPKPHCTSTIS